MISPRDFYSDKAPEASVKVVLIEQSLYEIKLAALPKRHQQWVQRQTNGKAGEMAFLYGEQGDLEAVYAIDLPEQRAITMAKLADKLPQGHYHLDGICDREVLLFWGKSQYQFRRYLSKVSQPKVLLVDTKTLTWLDNELSSLFLVRDLINTPTNDMGPTQLAQAVEDLANQFDGRYETIVGNELLTQNFPAIHAVGRAAADAPRLAALHWGDDNAPHIALVGKGVCFDSGGLDIKPAQYMRLMKKDMGGAANAIGLARWIMANNLPVRLSLYIAAVENAVGADAFRPGDVLTMRNGLTVEIDNTDAEGRLVLADAITRACEDEPDLLIDMATLTGAARAAVGTDISAMFCNDDALAFDLLKQADTVSDPLCRLPLFSGYASMLDSPIADMVNSTGSPYAGAITAALFLQRFVLASTPWLHFDIMAWNVGTKPGKPIGGEAMSIRAVAAYLNKQYGNP